MQEGACERFSQRFSGQGGLEWTRAEEGDQQEATQESW